MIAENERPGGEKKISVALAAYQGEKYIEEQLRSILSELPGNAEVIVSDDLPGGETQRITERLAAGDPRVHWVKGPGKGVTANFENALRACSGEYIFLADQDDVWLPGKVQKVCAVLDSGAALVLHDAEVTDAALHTTEPSFFAVHSSRGGFLPNLVRNSFVGCCMAFRRSLLEEALPFPEKVPMHDWWIALIAFKKKEQVVLLPEVLIKWRRHESTVTGKKNSVFRQLSWRVRMGALLLAK